MSPTVFSVRLHFDDGAVRFQFEPQRDLAGAVLGIPVVVEQIVPALRDGLDDRGIIIAEGRGFGIQRRPKRRAGPPRRPAASAGRESGRCWASACFKVRGPVAGGPWVRRRAGFGGGLRSSVSPSVGGVSGVASAGRFGGGRAAGGLEGLRRFGWRGFLGGFFGRLLFGGFTSRGFRLDFGAGLARPRSSARRSAGR